MYTLPMIMIQEFVQVYTPPQLLARWRSSVLRTTVMYGQVTLFPWAKRVIITTRHVDDHCHVIKFCAKKFTSLSRSFSSLV